MQAPGFRMNEREVNPNPYVGFIRALKAKKDNTDAEMILKAVAAQMKKIMEQRYMFVHTLEEAEFNTVFAGRNWNHGQSIELVLRGPSGRFLPLPYITSVMCHEMAHIEQMNHGPKFQALMRDIKADVARMQARGNYGDGFWSDGQRLRDSVKMGGEGLRPSDFPEYVCGVTAGDARKARRPRKRASAGEGLVKGVASHLSGRQTEYRRKAGRKNNVDMGEASGRLDGGREITKQDRDDRKAAIDVEVERLINEGMAKTRAKTVAGEMWDRRNPWYKEGNTRGKKAKSKSAAEMRAAAAEARLRGLSTVSKPAASGPSSSPIKRDVHSPLKSSQEDEQVPVKEEEEEEEEEYWSEDESQPVVDPHVSAQERKREMEDEMDDGEMDALRGGWEDYVETEKGKKRDRSDSPVQTSGASRQKVDKLGSTGNGAKGGGFGADVIRQERLKALGLASTTLGRTERVLGGSKSQSISDAITLPAVNDIPEEAILPDGGRPGWTCRICTFVNIPDHGRCEMCQARPDGTIPDDIQA